MESNMRKLIAGPIKDPITAEEVKPRPLRPPRRRHAEHDFDRGELPRIPSGEGPSVEQSPPTQNVLTTEPEPNRSIKFDSYTPMVDPSLPELFNLVPPIQVAQTPITVSFSMSGIHTWWHLLTGALPSRIMIPRPSCRPPLVAQSTR